MEIIPIKTGKIKPQDDLIAVLMRALTAKKIKLKNGDIIAIVSKVVALTEGGLRYVGAEHSAARKKKSRYGVYQDSDSLLEYIRSEADVAFDDEMFLTIKNNIFTPSAGVDTSNVAQGYAIGWPKDSYESAEKLRGKILDTHGKLKKLGILIFDSHITPLRNGITGVALGYSGFHGVEDYRGKKDLFGNILRVTQKNFADGLAAAATLVCGEGSESIPFVLIRAAPVKWIHITSAHHVKNATKSSSTSSSRVNPDFLRTETVRAPQDCLYRVLYQNNKKMKSRQK